MGITYQIPQQARFIPTSTVFSAPFNVTIPGKYDFTGTVANQNVSVLTFQPNTVYLIERMSAGGNITEGQFLESISTFPSLYVKKQLGNRVVYEKPIPIANYFDGQEAAAYVISDKGGDQLLLTFEGVLNQLPSMIGIATVYIQISLNVFAIDSNFWNNSFRDRQAYSIGQNNRR